MNIFHWLTSWKSSRKSSSSPSLREELAQLVRTHAERQGVSPEVVLARLGKGGPLGEGAERTEAAELYPDSRCLDAAELFEAAATGADILPRERQEHLSHCPVCDYALRLAVPHEEQIAAMAERLARSPAGGERPTAAGRGDFDPAGERAARRERQLASLQAGVGLQRQRAAAAATAGGRQPAPDASPAWLGWLLSPGVSTAVSTVLIAAFFFGATFLNSRRVEQAVSGLSVELEGTIRPAEDPAQKGKFVITLKESPLKSPWKDKKLFGGTRLCVLDPGEKSDAFDKILLSGHQQGTVSGRIIEFDKSGRMVIAVQDVEFGKGKEEK